MTAPSLWMDCLFAIALMEIDVSNVDTICNQTMSSPKLSNRVAASWIFERPGTFSLNPKSGPKIMINGKGATLCAQAPGSGRGGDLRGKSSFPARRQAPVHVGIIASHIGDIIVAFWTDYIFYSIPGDFKVLLVHTCDQQFTGKVCHWTNRAIGDLHNSSRTHNVCVYN